MYQEQSFSIGELQGISAKTIEEHTKLYAGYVKHANLVLEKVTEYSAEAEKNAYAISELQRRFSFEFNGIRNHEIYFRLLEGGAQELSSGSALKTEIENTWGSFDAWLARFKTIAMTRGIGWAMLYYDTTAKKLVHAWVDEQHLGQLQAAQLIIGLDMWEHSYMLDYAPSEKKKYIEAFFGNINWQVAEAQFQKVKDCNCN